MLYGSKVIVIPSDVFAELTTYIKILRASMIDDGELNSYFRFVFVSSRFNSVDSKTLQMKHSVVSNCLTTTFKNAGILMNSERSDRVSCTRVRASVATELAGMGNENLEKLATVFMKHKPDTCRKFYVKNYANRESLRISMKCYDAFKLNPKTADAANSLRSKALKRKIPSLKEVKAWVNNQESLIKDKFGVGLLDDELNKLFNQIELEEQDECGMCKNITLVS